MDRRTFVKNTGITAATLGVLPELLAASPVPANPLPRWRGFNLLDFFVPNPAYGRASTTDDYLRWMRDWGFDFVRVPMAYPAYLDIDYQRDINPEDVYRIDEQRVERIDELVTKAGSFGLHISLNLHRAPGYCINAGFHEPFNLWKDQAAVDAFSFHWNMWAKRYREMALDKISFDLVNEPAMREDMNDQHSKSGPLEGEVYRRVAEAAVVAIRKENPNRIIIADGNSVGNSVTPELIDLRIAQSCRGYNPGSISHYKAPWANSDPEHMPVPVWPGQVGNRYLSREMLQVYYQSWIDLAGRGVGVHCGECGCWNKTPHDVFLAWFGDVLDILKGNDIGYALWEFVGDFGVIDSRRTDVAYEDWHGHKLDRQLLELLRKN